MPEILWDPSKAGQVGNTQGQMVGYVAGLYSIPGMANIAAAPTEVLNQYGYSVYQDTDTGHFNIVRDNYANNNSIWTSQSLGVTLDYTGDKLELKDMNGADTTDESTGDVVQSSMNSFGTVTAPNFDYTGYTNNARSSFATTSQNILNRLNASQSSGTSYSSTVGLGTDETIDPLTKGVVDKEKSAAVDELLTSESAKFKFDNIAKLINKVAEKQSQAEVEAQDHSAGGALGGAAAGAGIGFCIGGPIGAAIGGAIGGIVGFLGGKAVAAADEGKAQNVNNEAAQEAKAAGDELKAALEGLSDEELIAFQRYYYEQSGVMVTDVLKGLETDDNSSKIAQGAGFDSGYLSGVFDNIDDANNTLKPDDTDDETVNTSNNQTTSGLTYSQSAQIEVLQQTANMYRQYWQMALQNGGSVEINGETKTADELSQLYIEANRELELYLDSINNPSGSETQMI